MNKLLTKICDKYEISDDVQKIILEHLQRKLLNGGWNHLHRPENIKWTKKYNTPRRNQYNNYPGGLQWYPLYNLFLLLFRDNPTSRLMEIYASRNYEHSSLRKFRRLDEEVEQKLSYPFGVSSSGPQHRQGCKFNLTKEQLMMYIQENTTFKVKKSWTKEEMIRTLLSGDRRLYKFEGRRTGIHFVTIISPQESSRRYLKLNPSKIKEN